MTFWPAACFCRHGREEGDACFELRAVQNERSASIFDVNEQTSDVRGVYLH